jgi:flagellar L-ring protein precursor FlgH
MPDTLFQRRIKNVRTFLIIILLSIYSFITCLTAGKILAGEVPQTGISASLYADVKAKKIGDVLTVIISESNTASKDAQTGTNKQEKADLTGTSTTGALQGLFPGMGGTMDVGNQYKGQASTKRSGKFASRMTVRVIDVLPNNSLVVEGTKTMEINEEVEVVTLSGVVQPELIDATNTVYSYQIANAKITYKGKGSVSQGHRIGLIGRVLNWIF